MKLLPSNISGLNDIVYPNVLLFQTFSDCQQHGGMTISQGNCVHVVITNTAYPALAGFM